MNRSLPPLPPKPKSKRKGGTPPKEYQFQPGQSGNPGGRPKKRPTMRDAFDVALDREVEIPLDGKRRKMSVRQAIAHQRAAGLGNAPLPDFIDFCIWLDGPAPLEVPEAANDFEEEDDRENYEQAIRRGSRRLGLEGDQGGPGGGDATGEVEELGGSDADEEVADEDGSHG